MIPGVTRASPTSGSAVGNSSQVYGEKSSIRKKAGSQRTERPCRCQTSQARRAEECTGEISGDRTRGGRKAAGEGTRPADNKNQGGFGSDRAAAPFGSSRCKSLPGQENRWKEAKCRCLSTASDIHGARYSCSGADRAGCIEPGGFCQYSSSSHHYFRRDRPARLLYLGKAPARGTAGRRGRRLAGSGASVESRARSLRRLPKRRLPKIVSA